LRSPFDHWETLNEGGGGKAAEPNVRQAGDVSNSEPSKSVGALKAGGTTEVRGEDGPRRSHENVEGIMQGGTNGKKE